MKHKKQMPTGKLELRPRYGSDRTPAERRQETQQLFTHVGGILAMLALLSFPSHALPAWGLALMLAGSICLGVTVWLGKRY